MNWVWGHMPATQHGGQWKRSVDAEGNIHDLQMLSSSANCGEVRNSQEVGPSEGSRVIKRPPLEGYWTLDMLLIVNHHGDKPLCL